MSTTTATQQPQAVTDEVWVLVNDFGDGVPTVGPFNTFEEADAHDPTDERFEPRKMPRTEAEVALAEARRDTEERYAIRQAYEQLRELVASGPTDDPILLDKVTAVTKRARARITKARKAAAAATEKASPAEIEKPRAAEPAAVKPAAEATPVKPVPAEPKRPPLKLVPNAAARPTEPTEVKRRAAAPALAKPSSAVTMSLRPGKHRKPGVPRWVPALAVVVLLVLGVALAALAGQPLWAVGGTALAAPLIRAVRRSRRSAGEAS